MTRPRSRAAAPAPVAYPGDPPVRADGNCATCHGPREPRRSRTYGGASAEVDPFCCSVCCRLWYTVPLAINGDEPEYVYGEEGCAACGVPWNWLTPGCSVCVARHRARIAPREGV